MGGGGGEGRKFSSFLHHPLPALLLESFFARSLTRSSFFAPKPGADLGRGVQEVCTPPRDDLRFSNTTGILQKKKKTLSFIGVEVE